MAPLMFPTSMPNPTLTSARAPRASRTNSWSHTCSWAGKLPWPNEQQHPEQEGCAGQKKRCFGDLGTPCTLCGAGMGWLSPPL